MPGWDGSSVNRRELLAGGVTAGALLALAGEEVRAQAQPAAAPPGPPVSVAVIGLGTHGRTLLANLARQPGVNVAAVCDTYAPFLTRARDHAPRAVGLADYRQVLERADVQAVIIATPTHLHREVAVAALQAGKHTYCEAPLAHTIEEARAIARAAREAKVLFQGGLQNRANPQHQHVNKFVRGGALGKVAGLRAQWHRKGSWRRTAPNPQREAALNWRLRRATSPGLVGEEGIHGIDTMNWFFRTRPTAVTGFGQTMLWNDGREVPDTVQCLFEYPEKFALSFAATLANSFDGTYELALGADAAVLLRGQRAWMFKEVDAPLLGWEVYARKETVGDNNGIALVADATKILALGKKPGEEGSSTLEAGRDALYYSLEAFVTSVREQKPTPCGPEDALAATVTALKANEAVLGNTRVVFQPEWYTL